MSQKPGQQGPKQRRPLSSSGCPVPGLSHSSTCTRVHTGRVGECARPGTGPGTGQPSDLTTQGSPQATQAPGQVLTGRQGCEAGYHLCATFEGLPPVTRFSVKISQDCKTSSFVQSWEVSQGSK